MQYKNKECGFWELSYNLKEALQTFNSQNKLKDNCDGTAARLHLIRKSYFLSRPTLLYHKLHFPSVRFK